MKKILALIICILLLLSTSACKKLDSKPVDSSSQISSETEIELELNLLRRLTGTHDITEIESLKIIYNNNSKEAVITDIKDWEFLKKYVLIDTVSYYEKEKLIASPKTNFLVIGTSKEDIYLLNDGRIIKQQMCGDSGVKTEDRDFEIYKADKKYILDEKALNKLLEKYDTEVVQFQTSGNASSNKNTSSKKDTVTSSDKSNISKKEPTSQGTTTVTKGELPDIKFSAKDSNLFFTDMVNLSNGGFAVFGYRYNEPIMESIIQVYDKNAILEKEYKNFNNIFNNVAICSDGGYLATSYSPSYITKINSSFEIEWVKPYENIEFFGQVNDIVEISPNLIAVLFMSVNSPDYSTRLKITYLNKNGELIETVDLMKNTDAQDADIIADGNGGYYLLSACDKELSEKYPLVAQSYDQKKGKEIAIMHFSADRKLIDAKTIGGNGDEWVEEATIDSEGNLLIVLCTKSPEKDNFWEMNIKDEHFLRRMLVKFDKYGKIVYKFPLSSGGLVVDQTYGIHIKDDKTLVVAMENYCVFVACIDKSGKELYRKIFLYSAFNEPSATTLLSNGSLVIAGCVLRDLTPFDVDFPSGVDRLAALFVYENV